MLDVEVSSLSPPSVNSAAWLVSASPDFPRPSSLARARTEAPFFRADRAKPHPLTEFRTCGLPHQDTSIANFDIQLSTLTTAAMATFSSDLLWEITKQQGSATLVKRAQSGGLQFSRDPLNLRNQYSRKVRLDPPTKHTAIG